MRELSNSSLALMVVLAIVISAFGTFMSMSKLSEIGGAVGLTGFATTDTGRANLTVPGGAFIVVFDDEIDLHVIQINKTNASGYGVNWVDDWWRIQNDGGVNFSVEVYIDVASGQLSGSGTYSGQRGWGPFNSTTSVATGCVDPTEVLHTCFRVKCNSTDSGDQCNNTYYSIYNKSGQAVLLNDLSYIDGSDIASFGINATVPPGEPAGTKIQFVTFEAAES
ncbi:hypothetical protein GOV09_05760 [Candidatus Woesearchaeota archaeon]|nr:hypothetical protein [Candidatus Woesearchaeota archaeon]